MKPRSVLRFLHIAAGGVLGTFVYSPWSDVPAFRLSVQLVVFPILLAATGLVMWQEGRFRRLFAPRRRGGDTGTILP